MPPFQSIFSMGRDYGQAGTPQYWQGIERQAQDPRFGEAARNLLGYRDSSYMDSLTGGMSGRLSMPFQSASRDYRYSMPYQSPTSPAMPASLPSTGGGGPDYFSSLASGIAGLMPTGAQPSGLSGWASRYGPGGSEEIARQRGYGVSRQVSSGAMRGFNDANRMTQQDRDAVRQETQDFRARMSDQARQLRERRSSRPMRGGTAGSGRQAGSFGFGGQHGGGFQAPQTPTQQRGRLQDMFGFESMGQESSPSRSYGRSSAFR